MQKYFILRLPWLFGLGGRPEINPILNLIKKAKAGEKTVVGRRHVVLRLRHAGCGLGDW